MLPSYKEVKEAAAPSLEKLEKLRKDIIRNRFKLRLLLAAIIGLTIILLVYQSVWGIIGCISCAAMACIYFFKKKKGIQQYRLEFKNKMVSAMFQSMVNLCKLPNETKDYKYYCDYRPKERINDDWIYRSKLFNFKIHAIHGEDLFDGRLGLTDFKFSELRLVEKVIHTDSEGSTTTTYIDRFKGVFFIADFHKDFNGLTVLESYLLPRKNIFGRVLGSVIMKLNSSPNDQAKTTIKLENEAFNEAFRIRTSDEVEARYLLPASMMERILTFKNSRRKEKIDISFVNSYMCVSIFTSKNYFEHNIKRELSDRHLQEVYADLSFFLGLIEEFNLNTRIWSKK